MWEPFVLWGEPTHILFNYVGIYNPFWLLIPILNACGLSYYQAFLFTIAGYFWTGMLGFYLLAQLILQNKSAAYFAFLLFLFSSISLSLFAQYHPPLLYVPGLWFLYFFFSFLKNPSRLTGTGLTLTAVLILTSYLPFYFLTVFVIICAVMSIFYFSSIRIVMSRGSRFVRGHGGLVLLSLAVLILAFMPGYWAYKSTVNKEVVVPFRNQNIEKKAGADFVDYERVAANGLSSRMDLEDIYANLDVIQYGDDCFFYLSFFFYIVLILGALLRTTRVMAVCVSTALPLLLFIMTSGTHFHRFVFEHVSYFKLIRNMHFFLPFLLAALCLLAAEQMRIFLENRKAWSLKKRPGFIIFIGLVHAALAFFLYHQPYIISSSYAALGLSFLFWLVFVFNNKRTEIILSVLLFLSLLVQPGEVFSRHNHEGYSASPPLERAFIEECLRFPSTKPVFSYVRPVSPRPIGNDDTAKSRITMTDASRFYEVGFPTFWSYDLTLREPFDVLQRYTRHKFYVYDGIKALKMSVNFTTAFAIEGPSEQFRVTHFDVNSIIIQTQYNQEKTLVYTDSYHKDWQAFINDRPAEIYRANLAFKGIDLPAGTNEIVLRYAPRGMTLISLSLVLVICLIFASLVWMVLRRWVMIKKEKCS